MEWTVAGIITLAVLAFGMINGWRRGLVKEVLSLIFAFLVFALVWVINPYVESFLRDSTGIRGLVYQNCDNFVQSVIPEGDIAAGQENIVEQLPLPQFIKNELNQMNTAQTYEMLDVSGIADYVTVYLTEKIFGGICFIISLILASIIIRILELLLEMIMKLPGLHAANHILGALLGTVRGLLAVWLIMLVLTMLCRTRIGAVALDTIKGDRILSLIYEWNPLAKMFLSV